VLTLSVDSEYGWAAGDECPSGFVPAIFCAICIETGERHAYWGRDPRLAAFIRGHAGDLFVSHNLIAEAKYLLRLGIRPPPSWWDSMVGYRYVTNREVVRPYGLFDALDKYGIPYPLDRDEKEDLQIWIGTLGFDPDSPDDRRRIRDYCFEDCLAAARLYLRLAGKVPPAWMAYATEYCLETARMELRGIGTDLDRYGEMLGIPHEKWTRG
jgi:hypothetical protein